MTELQKYKQTPAQCRRFVTKILAWYDQHGRKSLPWQQQVTPYKVWVSEVMLQQTTVATVINYYPRFIQRFPSISALAAAEEDHVLALWSGLGYYRRARLLYKAAKQLADDHHGELPNNLQDLIALPGIGRSTAGAILSLGFHKSAAILDGNVKRVLSRYFAIEDDLSKAAGLNNLWHLAELLTPIKRVQHYNQAMMDIGATLCTRSQPQCLHCPIEHNCQARIQANPQAYPVKNNKKAKRQEIKISMMVIVSEYGIYLQKRPSKGIWAGMWGFPEGTLKEVKLWIKRYFQATIADVKVKPCFVHELTHRRLVITPYIIQLTELQISQSETGWIWYHPSDQPPGGLAVPVTRIINDYFTDIFSDKLLQQS